MTSVSTVRVYSAELQSSSRKADRSVEYHVEPGREAITLLGDLQVNLQAKKLSWVTGKSQDRNTYDRDTGLEVRARAEIVARGVVKNVALQTHARQQKAIPRHEE